MTNTESTTPSDTAEHWEQIRRSIAMLPTGSWALKREQALEALSILVTRLRTSADETTPSEARNR